MKPLLVYIEITQEIPRKNTMKKFKKLSFQKKKKKMAGIESKASKEYQQLVSE